MIAIVNSKVENAARELRLCRGTLRKGPWLSGLSLNDFPEATLRPNRRPSLLYHNEINGKPKAYRDVLRQSRSMKAVSVARSITPKPVARVFQ
jgi:hypothetical protein